MTAIFREDGNLLQTLHTAIQKEIECLPLQALDWIPADGANSLAALVMHTAGSERYWIGDVILGEGSHRNREAEFQTVGLEASTLILKLNSSLDYIRAGLERLDPNDLERECVSPRDGRRVTAAWALLHTLEHTAMHTGHIQLTRQLWDQSR